MPETLKGLWKQRLRWAQGGAEVFLKNMTRLWRKENFRMWPLFFEYCLTTIWAFTCLVGFIIYAALSTMPPSLPGYGEHHPVVPG